MGRASIAIFGVLAGYVNALGPIKRTRVGNIDAALSGIAKSAFRRTGRFVIPAMVATTSSWLLCQFGAYRLAKQVKSNWIRDTSPSPSASFASAFTDLFTALITTWTSGANRYDRIQWTLTYLLRGSMLVYLSMFATAYVRPRFRMLFYGLLYCFYWRCGDGECIRAAAIVKANSLRLALIGINVFWGLILAELTLDPDVQAWAADRELLCSAVSTIPIVLGLFFISYPEDKPEWARWSRGLIKFGQIIFPGGSEFARFYPGFGINVLTIGILFNGPAKKLLAHPALCWMGKMSFAVYLLHAPLIRTLLTWMLFGASSRPPSKGKDDKGHDLPPDWLPVASRWVCAFAIPLFYAMLYRIAAYWTTHVDPWCGRVTNWIEEATFRDEARAEKPILGS